MVLSECTSEKEQFQEFAYSKIKWEKKPFVDIKLKQKDDLFLPKHNKK